MKRLTRTRVAAFTVLFLLAAAGASAQPTEPQAPPDVPLDDQVDARDLFNHLRKRQPKPELADAPHLSFTLVPIIGSNPTSGVIFGAGAHMALIRPGAPISSGILTATISTRGEPSLSARFRFFSKSGEWLLEGDNRFQLLTQPTYGFGTDTPDSAAVDARFDFVRIQETLSHKVRGPLFAGGGLFFDTHGDIRPGEGSEDAWDTSAYVQYSEEHGFDVEGQRSAGLSLNVQVDTRDNPIDARRGILAAVAFDAAIDGFLGGDSDWQAVIVDVRGYRSLGQAGRKRLALWFYGDLVLAGAAPYFDVPATVTDTFGRSARGYREGRFRGERLLYWEGEYRHTVTKNGLFGVVGFASVTTVTNSETGEHLFDAYAPAAGGGVRLSLDKRTRSNVCLDVGWGKGNSWGIYLAIQEAF